MQPNDVNGRFHIFTGYREGSTIKNELQAGEAYQIQTKSRAYFVVKMWAFPRDVFYLVANRSSNSDFTLFAKKIGGEDTPTFRRPVGFGFVSNELKQHLEIQFTFPRQRVFMSLFPDQVTIDSLFGADGGVA
jgi:hypothetical protein